MRKLLLFSAIAASSIARAALPSDVLIIESGADRIFRMTQSAVYNGDFAGPALSPFGTPEGICEGPNGTILVTGQLVGSDTSTGAILKFSESGTYLGPWASPGKLLRGISRRKNGTYLVANGTDNTVDSYSAAGVFLGVFAATPSPWHARELQNGEVLISRSTTFSGGNTPQVERYSSTGLFLGNFATGYPFTRQIHELGDGNILIACFSLPQANGKGNAAYEFTPSGIEAAIYQLDGPRGVMELADGKILVTDGTEMAKFDRGGGNKVNLNDYNKTGSTSCRMMFSKFCPVQIRSNFTLQGWSIDSAGVPVTFEFVKNGAVEFTKVQNVNPTDVVSFSTTVRGTYDIYVSASHWLRKKIANVNVDEWGAVLNYTLLNGDVDHDNVVSVFDYIILSDAFDADSNAANWDERADLDGDGVVSVFDYILLSDNFDVSGDDY